MKKIVYSTALKLVAVILLIACVALGALAAVNGVMRYDREEQDIYSFESDFSESWYLAYLLSRPENIVFDAYYRYFEEGETAVPSTEQDGAVEEETEAAGSAETEAAPKSPPEGVAEILGTLLEDLYETDEIHYFVQWNDRVFTNCGATSAEELTAGEYYSYVKWDGDSLAERVSTVKSRSYPMDDLGRFDSESVIVISCNVRDSVAKEYRAIWELQERIVMDAIFQTAACAVAALLLFIYLLAVCGKNKNGEYERMWLDNVWLEVHLAATAGAGIGAAAVGWFVLDEYIQGHFPRNLVYWALGGAAALGSLLILTSLLSVARNLKTGRLMEASVVFRVARWILRWLFKMILWIGRGIRSFGRATARMLSRKTGVILTVMLLLYTALLAFLIMIAAFEPIVIPFALLLFLLACFVVANRAGDLDEVKKGVSEVRRGNVTYQIPPLKCGDMKALAADVNGIAQGLDEAVSAKVKAERLKTELITNVSHDLKTPITSIISYAELLSQVEGLPEEALDYASVIAKKSDRLKKLTQDLFDISKAQSGNDEVAWERLNVALLIEQALAEHDREIQGSELPFCVETSKELYISADGRKMSRAVSNLIQNILKYAMKNTRVFVTAAERDGRAVITFKNVSAYPLDFDAEEITQRFARGDASRTAEGNGLGLAIAKSYTELCGGAFEIIVDGDLFKAVLTFPTADAES